MIDPINVIARTASKCHLWRPTDIDFDDDVETRDLHGIEYAIYIISAVILLATTGLYEYLSGVLGLPPQESVIAAFITSLLLLMAGWAIRKNLARWSRFSESHLWIGYAIFSLIITFLQSLGYNAPVILIALAVFSGFGIFGVSEPGVPTFGRFLSVIALWLSAVIFGTFILQFEAWVISYLDPSTRGLLVPPLSVVQAYLLLVCIFITCKSTRRFARGVWIIAWVLFLIVGVIGSLLALALIHP